MLYIIGILLLITMIGIYRAYQNTQQFSFNRIHINAGQQKSPKINVLHISDMHLENISVTPEKLYETLKDEQIDLIALTGDFLDRKRTFPKLPAYLKVFQQLNPKEGIYAVFGNHDYVLRDNDFQQLQKMLLQYDCKILRNHHKTLNIQGAALNLIGIDDYSTGNSDIKKAYKSIPTDGYNLVLTHDPNVVLELEETRFDYLLSGHFHGGQIHWPRPYHLAKMGALVRLKMVKGLHHLHGKPFYISEGLGQTGVNIRIGSRPEITMHEVVLSKENSKEIPA